MQRCFIDRKEQEYLKEKHKIELENEITYNANKMDIHHLEDSMKILIENDEDSLKQFKKLDGDVIKKREMYIKKKLEDEINENDE